MIKGFAEFSCVATVLEQPKGVKSEKGTIYTPLKVGLLEVYAENEKTSVYVVNFFNSAKSELAKHVAKGLSKGDTVLLQGRIGSFESKDGKVFSNLIGRSFKKLEAEKSDVKPSNDAFEDVPF